MREKRARERDTEGERESLGERESVRKEERRVWTVSESGRDSERVRTRKRDKVKHTRNQARAHKRERVSVILWVKQTHTPIHIKTQTDNLVNTYTNIHTCIHTLTHAGTYTHP